MNILTIMFGTFIVGSFKSYGEAFKIKQDLFLSVTGALASVFACFRFIWSFLLDHFSYKKVYGSLIALQILLAWTFPIIIKSQWLFSIWVSLTFFCEGGHFTLAPAIYKKLFGSEGVRVFGWGFTFIGIASLL